MSLLMLIACGGGTPGNGLPAPSAVVGTLNNAGSCPVSPGHTPTQAAIVRVTWAMANQDNASYSTSVFKNGSLLASSIPNTTLLYDDPQTGYVDGSVGGVGAPVTNVDNVYRVDVVRRTDSVTVGSATAASHYINTFWTCNGTA